MRVGQVIAIAVLFAPLVASSCGGGSQEGSARQQNTPNAATTRPMIMGPENDMGPAPQNMPGGGRGSDPPHFKGKP